MSRRKRNPSHTTVINAALEMVRKDAERRYQEAIEREQITSQHRSAIGLRLCHTNAHLASTIETEAQ